MKALLTTALVVATLPASGVLAAGPPQGSNGCKKTYTRSHFHRAAHSTFDRAFPLRREYRTLHRIIRCQRYRKSDRIVRMHMRRYRHEWAARFYFEHAWARIPYYVKVHLASIASCESGGSPTAIGGGGAYRGKYQFAFSTWRVVGGSGDPAAAPEIEQDVRAAWLLMKYGAGHWPVCG